MDAIFYEKSSLIKAIWQPNKLFKELLRKLWKCLVDSSSRFTAVHVRRSDKIATGEANAISLSTYADAVHNICRKDPRNCPRNVFVMSDEEGVYDELRTHLWSSFQVSNGSRRFRFLWTLPLGARLQIATIPHECFLFSERVHCKIKRREVSK